MAEPGLRPPSIPVPYRLALALSLAVLVHTLLLAGLPSPFEEAREIRHRLVFKLSPPASQPGAAALAGPTAAELTDESQELRHQDFHVDPNLPVITTSDSPSRTTPRPVLERSAAPAPQNQRPSPAEATGDKTPPTQTSADSAETTVLPAEPATEQAPSQQVATMPIQHDPYLARLASHLAETLEQRRVPAISKLNETVTMELELRILPNGALTDARVVKSTGVPGIDDAAYRAALAASPYPEPEGERSDRFEVKLVFAPKRY